MCVETNALKYIHKQLQEHQIVTITGVPGSGKSFIARHVALKLQYLGWNIVLITSIDQVINRPINPRLRYVYVSDDPVGTGEVDSLKLANAEACDEYILDLLRKSNNKILFTCRKQIVQDTNFLAAKSLLSKNIIDLSGNEFKLTKSEKVALLLQHTKFKKQLDNMKDKDSFTNFDCPNFPLLCKLFTTKEEYITKGSAFFTYPFQIISDELENMKHRQKTNFCALAICLMFDSVVDEHMFDVFTVTKEAKKSIRNLIEACGLPKKYTSESNT